MHAEAISQDRFLDVSRSPNVSARINDVTLLFFRPGSARYFPRVRVPVRGSAVSAAARLAAALASCGARTARGDGAPRCLWLAGRLLAGCCPICVCLPAWCRQLQLRLQASALKATGSMLQAPGSTASRNNLKSGGAV